MTFEIFQEQVRAELDRQPGAHAWDVYFTEEELDWLIIVVDGSAFASLVVPACAENDAAADVVRHLERMITTQKERGPPRRRRT